jgi:hypothetical protein
MAHIKFNPFELEKINVVPVVVAPWLKERKPCP